MAIVELGSLEMDEEANGEIQAFGQQQHVSVTDLGPQPGVALANCMASGNVVITLSFFFLICKVGKYDHTWCPWGTVKCPRSSGWNPASGCRGEGLIPSSGA